MQKNLYWALVCLILTSCGAPSKPNPRPVPAVFETSLSSTPLFLFKQNLACEEKALWETFDLDLHLFLLGEHRMEPRNFEGLIDENLLRSKDGKAISRSVYGEAIEYLHDNHDFLFLIHQGPRDIELCSDQLTYSSYSIESAALNAAFFINQTREKYQRANPSIELPPVVLKISPEIKQTVIRGKSKQSLYFTDNAFYQPHEKSITFLPHSLQARMGGFIVSFWEVPVVAAHEYGHHIFNTHFDFSLPGAQSTDFCFNNRTAESFVPSPTTTRKVDHSLVLQAMNEGFADLIAYYTLGEDESNLTGVKCMEFSRDVKRDSFKDGRPKTFSSQVLNSFFSPRKEGNALSCEVVDYQDIHTLGAIFAYNADRFLSTLTESNENKLQVLNDWAKGLKENHSQLSKSSPRRYFEEVFKLFLRLSLKKFDKKFDRSSCDEVNKIYPGLKYQIVECS